MLKKKLESRRLDYDAKLGKVQKAKKERPDLEQDMQAAKTKYEDTEADLRNRMIAFVESEVSEPDPDGGRSLLILATMDALDISMLA